MYFGVRRLSKSKHFDLCYLVLFDVLKTNMLKEIILLSIYNFNVQCEACPVWLTYLDHESCQKRRQKADILYIYIFSRSSFHRCCL